MTDTTNPTATVTSPVQRRIRVRDALTTGGVQLINSGCKIINSAAAITTGIATRVTLYNAAVYMDMVEDANGDETKVTSAVNTVLSIGQNQ